METLIINSESTLEEKELTESILDGKSITDSNLKELIEKVKKLDFISIVKIYNYVHDKLYNCDMVEKDPIFKFLSNNCFEEVRTMLIIAFDNEDYCGKSLHYYEEKYNIIIDNSSIIK